MAAPAVAMDFVDPVPIRLPVPGRGVRLRRLGASSAALAHRVGPLLARRALRWQREGDSLARALRMTVEDLGATYVKFGQAVASSPAIVPEAIADEFRDCLDKGPAIPFARVRAIIERDLGRPLPEIFSRFEQRPVASASIAVVHRAWRKDGTPVAVKVLRPGIESVVAADIDLMEPLFRMLARQGIGEAGNAVAYLVGLRHQVAEELDLRNEVRTMAYFRTLFARFELDLLVIPEVHEEFCGRHVLTMQFMDGAPIDDLASADKFGVDPAPLVRQLLRAWVLTALRAGVFHADIHAGNLMLLRDGRLAMLDWGIVARVDPDTRRMFRGVCEVGLGQEEAWEVLTDHVLRTQGVFLTEGMGATRDDVRAMVKSIMEPVLMRPMSDVSMATLFMSPEQAYAVNNGTPRPKRTLKEKWQMNRTIARAYRKAMDAGQFEAEVQRQTFLAAKQLLYLERYGRMYLPDEALLSDKEFLRAALAE